MMIKSNKNYYLVKIKCLAKISLINVLLLDILNNDLFTTHNKFQSYKNFENLTFKSCFLSLSSFFHNVSSN